jgi:hypothetical protein
MGIVVAFLYKSNSFLLTLNICSLFFSFRQLIIIGQYIRCEWISAK